jgi:hypothetical protein
MMGNKNTTSEGIVITETQEEIDQHTRSYFKILADEHNR